MIVVGLTGSIGMGKTTAARMLGAMGLPVHDSDAVVHRLLGRGGAAVAAVGAAFPEVVSQGAVDRAVLGARVFEDAAALARLEAIVHPLARRVQDRFLRRCASRRSPVAVLDIPLLFELGLDSRCDACVVVTAPRFVQEARVLSRPGMTREKFEGILSRQMPDIEKRRRADFLVPTGSGRRRTLLRLRAAVAAAAGRPPRRWPPGRRR